MEDQDKHVFGEVVDFYRLAHTIPCLPGFYNHTMAT